MKQRLLLSAGLLAGFAFIVSTSAGYAPTVAGPTKAAKEGGWGVIKGQIVYAGPKVPERPQLKVDKDQDHCLAKGPLLSEQWVVNPQNKGVRWVVVFLNPGKEKLPVHPSLAEPGSKEVVVDQPMCAFEPHVFAMRADQTLLAKNSAPVAHNVVINGFKNEANIQIPPGRSQTFTLEPEKNAIKLTCGAHQWMTGYGWIFEHPYFAVTDADGKFEIKNAPSGARNLVIWHETGYLGGAMGKNGRPIDVAPDTITDLGKIEFKPN